MLPLRRLLFLGVILAAAAVSFSKEAAGGRVTLVPSPQWTTSALWATGPDGGRELLVADVRSGRVLRYSAEGAHLGSLRRPGRGSLEFDHPTAIGQSRQGLILKQRLGKLLWLGPDLEPHRSLDLSAVDLPAGISSLGLLDEVISQGSLFGLASMSGPKRTSLGFSKWRLSPFQLEEFLEEVDPLSKAGTLYRLQRPVLARAAGAVYALRFGEPSFILRLSEPVGRLESFPAGFESLPSLPPSRGPSTDAARYAALERSSVPVALYGRGDYLYLLTRRPGDSATVWELSKIDPATDSLLGSRRLPTRAAHLTLAPGSPTWAVLEKGPVIGSGQHAGPFDAVFLSTGDVEGTDGSP